MIEWEVGDESELGSGKLGDVNWRFEAKVYGGPEPYKKTATFFYFNLTPNIKKEDWLNNTETWKGISRVIPALICMRFEIHLHKKVEDTDKPLIISQLNSPDEISIYKQVLAGLLPVDWRRYEAVEDLVIYGESSEEFRSYIRQDAEDAVNNNVLPVLKTLWRLGCHITTDQIKIPEGPIWAEEYEEE